ncbi:DUF4214 domain-containing protein [Methylobacterium oxalidis]|uniref:DUF4214 domain-containing protein n=1 Tax=Methylobacterium oxalidis TaxID=944322 RepID=A0A512IX46_9HYPH|nr:DUF4214 domain-containing protein [Methylobacterium oxalidis]GEP02298.1 hypothetical protein MOX02_03360 [Methylobacterium oxalidis]GJE31194.1 hypothetical protein LDDCCGHA_1370 [Methylobacterium oxalidis]GLS67677.1 hypothetical protein GCM10007888_60620 [Methylobacterium oxalidis]
MADPYSRPVEQVKENIIKNPQAEGLKNALEQLLKTRPNTSDPNNIDIQNVTPGTTVDPTVEVANVDASQGGNVTGAGKAPVLNISGSGTVTGKVESQFVSLDSGQANLTFNGAGPTTVVAGSGDANLSLTSAGGSTIVAGTGDLNIVAGNAGVSGDLTQTQHATVNAGSGDDTLTLGAGSYKLNLGSGDNTVTLTSSGYNVSRDADGNIVLKNGNETSTLTNVDVIKLTDGSTIVNASTVDEAIISRMYVAVMDRTADANGLYYWWDQYNSGKLSLEQIGEQFLGAPEAGSHGLGSTVTNEQFVNAVYQNLFGRTADAGGLAYWSNELATGGMSRADLLLGLTSTAEGAGATAQTTLVSERAPTESSPVYADINLADGSQTVAGGSAFDTVNFGLSKADFSTVVDGGRVLVFHANSGTATTIENSDFIKFTDGVLITAHTADEAVIGRMYEAVMARDADASGLQYWWQQHASGQSMEDIAHAFMQSPEFQQGAGKLENPAFVDQIYQNLFGRDADQAGHVYWTKELNAGMSREDFVLQLASSGEGADKTADSIKLIDHTGH